MQHRHVKPAEWQEAPMQVAGAERRHLMVIWPHQQQDVL